MQSALLFALGYLLTQNSQKYDVICIASSHVTHDVLQYEQYADTVVYIHPPLQQTGATLTLNVESTVTHPTFLLMSRHKLSQRWEGEAPPLESPQ